MTLPAQVEVPTITGTQAKIVLEFQALAEAHNTRGPFLEVGAGSRRNAILTDDYFKGADRHAIGFAAADESDGLTHIAGNPNDMRALFKDGRFSTVLWNCALAHDKYFWRSLEEITRVLIPGGVLIVATPGFAKTAKFGVKVVGAKGNAIANATVTGRVHTTRPDYWRISPQAMNQIILEGFDVREVRVSMVVPRVFGVGVKPA